MKRTEQRQDALRPIGLAMSAVMAGLSAQAASAAPATPAPAPRAQAHSVDPSNDPRHEEDASLILGPSPPVEPFAEAPKAKQADLFDL